jgi:hypothetical protein
MWSFSQIVPVVCVVLCLCANTANASAFASVEDRSAADMAVSDADRSAIGDVIAALRAPNVCFERTEHSYWTYAYCPALAKSPIRQYFAQSGKFNHLTAPQKHALGDALQSFAVTPKHLSLHYVGGDACESGVKRSSEVRLICNPRMRNSVNKFGALVEVSEVKQCQYRISIETPLTCDLRFYAAQLDSTHATKASLLSAVVRTSSATALPPTPSAAQLTTTTTSSDSVNEDADEDAEESDAPPLTTYEHRFNLRRVPLQYVVRPGPKSWWK